MHLSLGQASKATGRSKSIISKALTTGKISYVSKGPEGYQIDPAELFRVFPPVSEQVKEPVPEQPTSTPTEPHQTGTLHAQINGLTALLAEKDQRLAELAAEKDNRIADLQADRDRWAAQAERLALTHQTASQPARPAPQTGLQRLFGFFRPQTPPQT